MQKLVDLTEVPYNEVNNSVNSIDYYNYKFFDKWDYSDILVNENSTDYENSTYYQNSADYEYYNPADLWVFPNLTQYSKLYEFLVKSANERNTFK